MIDKNIWGSHLWNSIHFISLGYPRNPSNVDKVNYKNFYENIVNIIPCSDCAEHLKNNLKNIPIQNFLDTREKLFEWTILLHNQVNKLLNRKEWTIQEAYALYTDPYFNMKNNNKCLNNSYFFISILLFIVIMVLLLKDKFIFKSKKKNFKI
jgi:hypothetical protein|tara:strand:- start:2276 stop:2731 length:456 start_codon:yes stop_codon:yes gene_type:complete